MRREREAFLWDILSAIDAIQTFVEDFHSDQPWGQDLLQTAIERKLEVIGEALRQSEAQFPGSTTRLPEVRLVVGMRDWLAHGYFAIDPKILWSTVAEDLPVLKIAVQRELNTLLPGQTAPSTLL